MTTLTAAVPPALERRRDPTSVASQVLAVLHANPDRKFRPVDISAVLDPMTTAAVANALRVLYLRGDIDRVRDDSIINGPGRSVYVYRP